MKRHEVISGQQLLYIGGEWTPAQANATFGSLDPFTGEVWAEVPDGAASDIDRAVRAARAALSGEWGAITGFDRAAAMRSLAALIERDAARIAAVESRDNGKLLRETQAQIGYLPAWLHYFAGIADKLEGETIPSDKRNFFIYTRHEPVGVVAAIVPWNSPLLLTMWKLAPALAAGCTFVLKPSDQTPVSALELARLVEEAGFPPGVFNVVTAQGPESSQALVAHPGVDKVTFTGSTSVGVAVAQDAAAHLAQVSLELGGKSAQLVFPDADVDEVVNGVVAGIFAASGQTCIAGSRLLVHRSLHDEVVAALVDRCRRVRLGDPFDPETDMGPVTNQRQWDAVGGFIERAVAAGAKLAYGGASTALGGLFVNPTIVTSVRPDMEIACEEVFGPVLAVLQFDDEDDAVATANDSKYGLAAGVWTADVRRAHRVAHRLRAGTVWVNSYRTVAPNAPFGGVGHSGWGRENGAQAVRTFTQTKTVWIELEGASRDPFVVG